MITEWHFLYFRTLKHFADTIWMPRSLWRNIKSAENWMLQIGHRFANPWSNLHCPKTSIKCKILDIKFIHGHYVLFIIRRYKKEDFQRMAELIVSVFPTETVETYFIPAQYGKHAKGKLWDSYNNLRQVLASVGFIERRSRKCKPPEEGWKRCLSVETKNFNIFVRNIDHVL